jgi:hypothetical protein
MQRDRLRTYSQPADFPPSIRVVYRQASLRSVESLRLHSFPHPHPRPRPHLRQRQRSRSRPHPNRPPTPTPPSPSPSRAREVETAAGSSSFLLHSNSCSSFSSWLQQTRRNSLHFASTCSYPVWGSSQRPSPPRSADACRFRCFANIQLVFWRSRP